MNNPDDAPLTAHGKVAILHRVASYHALCESVRKSSVVTLMFGVFMLAMWGYLIPEQLKFSWFGIVVLSLGLLEFVTGFLNRFAPSAEGVFLDGLVLLAFGGWNLIREVLIWKGLLPGRVDQIYVLIGVFYAFRGFQTCKYYFVLRRLFAERPTREQIRWYNGLLKEVRYAEPKEDPQALALPTRPPVTAKLLGDIAFFAIVAGEPIITTRDQVMMTMLDGSGSEARAHAVLAIQGHVFEPFPISRANWENYHRWKEEG